jgi:hypothetical protein
MSETTKRNTNAKRRLFGKAPEEDNAETAPKTTAENKDNQSNIILETPQKKKKQKVGLDFFSPNKGKPVVTPDKVEGEDISDDEVEVVSPPLKKTRLSERYSPQPKEEAYVPTYIHKNLSYMREGTASLPAKVKKVFQLVVENFEIADDFEQNRSYGPLSGVAHEERVISAYNLSMLQPKNGQAVEICSSCVSMGHRRNDCPDLI